jgi:hypothetical protein
MIVVAAAMTVSNAAKPDSQTVDQDEVITVPAGVPFRIGDMMFGGGHGLVTSRLCPGSESDCIINFGIGSEKLTHKGKKTKGVPDAELDFSDGRIIKINL